MTAGQPPLVPDDRRPKAPHNRDAGEAEGPPEPAGARYALAIPTPLPKEVVEPERGLNGQVGRGESAGELPTMHKRAYRPKRRCRIVMLRFDEREHESVQRAAVDAGLTISGYAALAALAATHQDPPPATNSLRYALAELMTARAQVRRFGGNVNQAVRQLNATGREPEWLERAVHLTNKAVSQLDEAAGAVARALK